MIIEKDFTFDSAHFLPNVPEDHKCRNMHGHTYFLQIQITGEIGTNSGWIMDFADIKELVNPVLKKIDHKLLNDIPGLENPTAENICVYLWDNLKENLPGLLQITLGEGIKSRCIYRGK